MLAERGAESEFMLTPIVIGSVHLARAEECRYAVEALLPGAQHQEAGASRACTIGEAGQEDPAKTGGAPDKESALATRQYE